MKKFKSIFLAAALAIGLGGVAHAKEVRCGWFGQDVNDRLYLKDKDHDWDLKHGPFISEGAKNFPQTARPGDCICLQVTVNQRHGIISKIWSGTKIPKSKCQNDPKVNWNW